MASNRVPFKSEAGWAEIYRTIGAISVPEGSGKDTLVRIGKREKPVFFGDLVASDHTLMRMSVCDLLSRCLDLNGDVLLATTVVGSDQPLVTFVVSELRYLKNRSTAPKEARGECRELSFERVAEIHHGEVVLVVEYSFTTGRTATLTDEVARSVGATTLPFVAALANLSGREEDAGKKLVSLVSAQALEANI